MIKDNDTRPCDHNIAALQNWANHHLAILEVNFDSVRRLAFEGDTTFAIELLAECYNANSSDAVVPSGKPNPVVERWAAIEKRPLLPRARRSAEANNRVRLAEFREQVASHALSAEEVLSRVPLVPDVPLEDLKILCVYERQSWLFPYWQFDERERKGLVNGLQVILSTLGRHSSVSPIQKAAFFVTDHPLLDGMTPLALLKKNEVHAVVDVAELVGVT